MYVCLRYISLPMLYHKPLAIIAKWKLNKIVAPCCYFKVYNNVPASNNTVLKDLLPKIIAGTQIICPQCISQSKITLACHVVITDYMEVKITALRSPGLARCPNKIFLKVSKMVPRLRRSDSKVGDLTCLATSLWIHRGLQQYSHCQRTQLNGAT